MTKAEIVQRLLDEKHITAEEAVILLNEKNTEIKKVNIVQPNPWYGTNPSTSWVPPTTNPYTIRAEDDKKIG